MRSKSDKREEQLSSSGSLKSLVLSERLKEIPFVIERLRTETLFGSDYDDLDKKTLDEESPQLFLLGLAALELAQRYFTLASIKEQRAEKAKLDKELAQYGD